jgi:Flp pilus assembly protein TadD
MSAQRIQRTCRNVLKKLKDIDIREIEKQKAEMLRLPGPAATPGSYDPRAAIRRKATPEQAQLLKAKEKLEISNFEEARKIFEDVLAEDPHNATALYGIA